MSEGMIPRELQNAVSMLLAAKPPVTIGFLYDPLSLCTTPEAAAFYTESLISWDQKYRDMSREESIRIHRPNICYYSRYFDPHKSVTVLEAFFKAWGDKP